MLHGICACSHFCLRAVRYAGIQRWQVVISGVTQPDAGGLYEHITVAEVLSYPVCRKKWGLVIWLQSVLQSSSSSRVVRKAAVWLSVGVFVYSDTVMLFYATMVKLS